MLYELLYSVYGFECYLYVGVFKQVRDFSYKWAVVCECCLYFLHMLFIVCMVFIIMVVLYLLV